MHTVFLQDATITDPIVGFSDIINAFMYRNQRFQGLILTG
jgi:hypothetical protein